MNVIMYALATTASAMAQEASWRVEPDAFGPARIGMTQKELETALDQRLKAVYPYVEKKRTCYYLYFRRQTAGVSFMMLQDRLARINVINTKQVSTAAGAKVGDSERRIKMLYGDALTITPHYYIRPKGHYLTVLSEDRRHGIQFESDGTRVVSYSSGARNTLKLVEGCS
jgi:hypothetical protein